MGRGAWRGGTLHAHNIKRKEDMANNFFLNQDPLLYNSKPSGDDVRAQLAEMLAQYQQSQPRPQTAQRDLICELDTLMSNIGDDAKEALTSDKEYSKLNAELQAIINREILLTIRSKVNSNPEAIRNMERQIEMAKSARERCDDEHRRSISELNDYVKNYSSITFDEYKRIKSGAAADEPKNNKGKKNTEAK